MKVAVVHRPSPRASQLCEIVVRGGDQVAWVAYDVAEVFERFVTDPPDLIIFDVGLAGFSDRASLERAVRERPSPMIVTSGDAPAEVDRVFSAMTVGAEDSMTISESSFDAASFQRALKQKMSRLKVLVKPSASPSASGLHSAPSSERTPHLVLVGASTGGPAALLDIMKHFDKGATSAFVLVQHVDVRFTAGLASFLSRDGGMPVELAVDGGKPRAGIAQLAASHDHVILTSKRLFLTTEEPKNNPHRPSIDVLFESVAAHWPLPGTAALLTGMGRDGARGLRALKEKGWNTIAQDEATSVVYGMPKAAVELGAVDRVLALPAIGPALEQACRQAAIKGR